MSHGPHLKKPATVQLIVVIERLTDPRLAGHLVFVCILKCWQQTEKNMIPLWRQKKIQLQANKTNLSVLTEVVIFYVGV